MLLFPLTYYYLLNMPVSATSFGVFQCQKSLGPFDESEPACVLCMRDHLTLLCQMATALIPVSRLLPFQCVSSDVHTQPGLPSPPPRPPGVAHYSRRDSGIIRQQATDQPAVG